MFHYLFIITGLFPDAAVILKVEDEDVVNRILPNKMVIWRRKRDKRLAIREAKKQKRIKEWASCWYIGYIVDYSIRMFYSKFDMLYIKSFMDTKCV